jgi:17beta-estradiol 17-dehydrogenase / very-long-chain 3-oxoacyl-CoA reductase
MLSSIIFALGVITAFTFVYRIWNFINLYFLHESTLPQYLHAGKNSYALITGSSDGIGLATAKALAKRGFNVIIHGRNPEKLASISEAMSKEFPNVQTVTVPADATDAQSAVSGVTKAIEAVEKSGGKLTVLVNNIGGMSMFGSNPHASLIDTPLELIHKQLDLNAVFPTMLTRALLPSLLANKPSIIINVGSYAGVYGFANISTYCGSKAFNHLFSKSLTAEFHLSKTPVEVLGILVGQVQTSGNPDDKPDFKTLTPDEMASSILGKVGCGKALVAGSWRHCLLGQLPSWLPEQMAEAMMNAAASKRNEREAKKRA